MTTHFETRKKRGPFDGEQYTNDSIALARKYFDEGWSFRVALKKSGHNSYFINDIMYLLKDDIFLSMLKDSKERFEQKRGSFISREARANHTEVSL